MLLLSAAAAVAGGCQPQPETTVTCLPLPELDASPPVVPVAATPAPIPNEPPPVQPAVVDTDRDWRYIVIHHSATERGNAEIFDAAHRRRGWDELGYHFVITNGDGGPDGCVQVGSRWRKQKWGAHCDTPDNAYNDYGIGICVVGSFSRRLPSRAQLRSLRTLVARLAREHHIPPERVIGHRQAPYTHTACPGGRLQKYINDELRPWLRSQSVVASER
jgi:N-acetyl-anhydromuramyl-L-alanine amidase AmpD